LLSFAARHYRKSAQTASIAKRIGG
jgi:hypothetical protein